MEIDTTSPQGNAIAILATVRQLFLETARSDEWSAVEKEMMSGDYDHLCEVAERESYGSITFV